jgi:hypothetical protein
LVDYELAKETEDRIFEIIERSKKLAKYKLKLHHLNKFGIDIEATAPGYEEFGIEVESTGGHQSWSSDVPYVTNWTSFSVPIRKQKFYKTHPMSLFVKVNPTITRVGVVPLVYAIAADAAEYDNIEDRNIDCNTFYGIRDSEHPSLCFCKLEDVADVIAEQFNCLVKMKRSNAKYTDMRPNFGTKSKGVK